MPKSFATERLQKPAATTTPLVHLQVPPGMDAALRGLTREVLRRQPSDLYLFAHRYFESLLADRVAQQGSEDAPDTEGQHSSKKQSKHSESSFTHSSSVREFFRDEESKREGSREIVHRIHLEDDSSSPKSVVHNINIEVEDEDASVGETKVKVEITDDGRKRSEKKRKESRDTTSFEEEVTRTRTEHVTVCKSWKVETRVETSESGEIRVVESFTDAGKPKTKPPAKKPRKFASEEDKKSQALIEEERKAAKTEREKKKKESSTKSRSVENVDSTASRELLILERQAAAKKMRSDEGRKYQSFIRLDDDESMKSQSERLIEIEREGEREDDVLTRSRREVEDSSTREASPDGPLLMQSPQVTLKKMEESLINLKDLEKKDEPETIEKTEFVEDKSPSKAKGDKLEQPDLMSPEDALNRMEKSLIELKESSEPGKEKKLDQHDLASPEDALNRMEKSLIELKESSAVQNKEEKLDQPDLTSPEDALNRMEKSLIELKESSAVQNKEEKLDQPDLTSPEDALNRMEKSLIELKDTTQQAKEGKRDQPDLTSPEDALNRMEKTLIELNQSSAVQDKENKPDQVDLTSPEDALNRMEKSLIESKESSAVQAKEGKRDQPDLTSPEGALSRMEKSLIELKGSSLGTELRTEDINVTTDEKDASLDPEKSRSLDEQQSIAIQSEDESKNSRNSEEKHRILENVKEVVHEVEEKSSSMLSHIRGSESLDEKQTTSMKSEEESKSSLGLEEKHRIIENVKEVVDEIEEKTASMLSHIHESDSLEEKQSMSLKSEEELKTSSISEEKHKIIESVKEVVHDIEEKTSDVLSHFPEKTESSDEKFEISTEEVKVLDPNPDDRESIVVEAQIDEAKAEEDSGGKSPKPEKKASEEPDVEDAQKEEAEDGDMRGRHKREVLDTAEEQEDVKEEHSGEEKEGASEDGQEHKLKATNEVTISQEDDRTSPQTLSNTGSGDKNEGKSDTPELLREKSDKDVKDVAEKSFENEELETSEMIPQETRSERETDGLVEKEKSERGATEFLEKEKSQHDTCTFLKTSKEKAAEVLEKSQQDTAETLEKTEQDADETLKRSEEEVAEALKESEQTATEVPKKEEPEQGVAESREQGKSKQSIEELPKKGEKSADEPSEKLDIEEKSTSELMEKERSEEGKSKSSVEKDELEEVEKLTSSLKKNETTEDVETEEKSEIENHRTSKEEKSPDSEKKDEKDTNTSSDARMVEDSVKQVEERVEQQIEEDETKPGIPSVGEADQDEGTPKPPRQKEEPLEKEASEEMPAEKLKEDTAASEPAVKEHPISSEAPSKGDAPQEQKASSEQEMSDGSAPGEAIASKETPLETHRIRRCTEETYTKTEELFESSSTTLMTRTLHLEGPERIIKTEETKIKEEEEKKIETMTEEVKNELIEIEDVFGHKMYPIEDTDTLDKQEDAISIQNAEHPVQDSVEKVDAPLPVESSSDDEVKQSSASDSKDDGESLKRESSEEQPGQRKQASLDDESSSVSDGTGDRFLPPTVVISRVADVVELTDGEAKIVSQMEKEGLTTEYDDNAKVKAGHWSADDANKFLAGESQHTYNSLKKPELFYSDLLESRPPEKPVKDDPEKESEIIEAPSTEYVVEEQDETPPEKNDEKIDSPGRDSDSTEGPVKFSLVEVDDDGAEIKETDKPWLARAHTVEEIFHKQPADDVLPVSPTPPRRKSTPGQFDVMMEMSKATSRIGQSIMVLSGGDKRPVQRADSDEYCISQDAIYIPLRPQGVEPDVVEDSDDEPFRIDQPPPTFSYDSDEGEWGSALAEHLKDSQPSLTTVIIERKIEDPTALGRVTITEITDEEDKVTTEEHATERKGAEVEGLLKPVFEIGSPVSDRREDPDLRGDAKHRPSLADISEENLESVDDTEASMNVELHISLSDGDNLSQRSYGTDSERKWTEDLSNVAHKAKDAATGMIKNLFSPRRDRQSPAGSDSSLISEAEDGKNKTRRRSVSKDEGKEPDSVKEPPVKSAIGGDGQSNLGKLQQEDEKDTTKRMGSEEKISLKPDTQDRIDIMLQEVKKQEEKEFGPEERDIVEEKKEESSEIVEVKPTLRSLPDSSETTQDSLTSISLPLPDASYDIQNMSLSTTDIRTPEGTDAKDTSKALEEGISHESAKITKHEEEDENKESCRSKRSVHTEDENDDPSKEDAEKKVPGSGAAAGTAVQKVAEGALDTQEAEDPRVSAKDTNETGQAGQEPVSEPKDSMTSVISETLDSVESLPSEVSKNLWSIEDVPLAEQLNESGVLVDEKPKDEAVLAGDQPHNVSKVEATTEESTTDFRDKDGGKEESPVKVSATEKVSEVVVDVLAKIESKVEGIKEKADDVKEEGESVLKKEEKKVGNLAHKTKDELRHKLERGVEVVQDSWEGIDNEGQRIKTEVKDELKQKSDALGDAVITAEEEIENAAESVRDNVAESVRDAHEQAEEIADKLEENIEKKAKEAETKVEDTVEEGKTVLSRMVGNVEHAISNVKDKTTSALKKEEEKVKEAEERTINKLENVTAEVSETVKEVKDKAEEKTEEEKSRFGKFIGGVTQAIVDVKENISDTAAHVKDGVKRKISDSEKKVEEEIIEIKDTVEGKVEKGEADVKENIEEGKQKIKEESAMLESKVTRVTDAVSSGIEDGKDKIEDASEKAREEFKNVKEEIIGQIERDKVKIDKVVEEMKGTADELDKSNLKDHEEGVAQETKIIDSVSKKEMDEVEQRLEKSIEHEDEGVDTVDSTEKMRSGDKFERATELQPELVGRDEAEEVAVADSTTKEVVDKSKSEEKSLQGATEVSARSLALPEATDTETVTNELDGTKTESSEVGDSSEDRRSRRHVLRRSDTFDATSRSAGTIPSESEDETSAASLERADTVVHVTLDEPDTSESMRKEEVVVPIHVEPQDATPVPPGKDTKATETDLLQIETQSRGTEPADTTEQIAEALRSEVKDLEERLSRLKESTWSLSHAGGDSKKGQDDVHASKSHGDWNPEDVTERTVHVKKSISSAESLSFASRVLSTPLGSVREEYSEMKKSTAETTHQTIFTVDKGVQSEGGETAKDGVGDAGPERRTTVTTATQVSVPSDEPSDNATRRELFQRAKSMDAKTEARAIANFSKRHLKTPSEQNQKAQSTRTEAEKSANLASNWT